MDFYESLELSNWKQLPNEDKETIFSSILMYFVSPLILASNRKLAMFEMCGMKCQTFQVDLNGESFVFIPGQKNTLLGWDFGTEGLKNQDLLGDEKLILGDEKFTYKSSLTKDELKKIKKNSEHVKDMYNFSSLEDIGEYINTYTSPLRSADIPPMLVAKTALPVGVELKGEYDAVSGQFSGNHDFLSNFRDEIREEFSPSLTLEESLSWNYPASILKTNEYYVEQQEKDEDRYAVYKHTALSFDDVQKNLDSSGFELMNEDEWEYAVGGGTRRLFRWGNEIMIDSNHPAHSVLNRAAQENMFGICVSSSRKKYELTNSPTVLKLGVVSQNEKNVIQQVLPMSSYYQSWQKLNGQEELNPSLYMYRKVIKIGQE